MAYSPAGPSATAVSDSAPQPHQPKTMGTRLLRISTDRLMGGHREIVLQHGLEEYRLRITAAGKLLLTK